MDTIKKTIIKGSSIYEETTTTRYVGDLNITKYREHQEKNKMVVQEFTPFWTPETAVFVDNHSKVITANRIEGVQFLAQANAQDNGMFKPTNIGNRIGSNAYPIYNFITTPPDGKKMWALTEYYNGRLHNMYIFISSKSKNSDSYDIHRAPLPNLSWPESRLCLGSAFTAKEKNFDTSNVPEKIHRVMSGGWNNDWHKNEVFFVEKDENTMKIRWHKPILQIGECVLSQDQRFISIINRLELEPNKYGKLKTIYLNPEQIDYERIAESRQNTESEEANSSTGDQNSEHGQTEQRTIQALPEPNTTSPTTNTQVETNRTPIAEEVVPATVPETIDLR